MIRWQYWLVMVLALAGCGKSNGPADPEVSRQLRLLRNGQLEERQAAAEALAKLKSPRAVEPLVISLSEPQPAVRQAAAFALGETGDKRAVNGLIRLLADTNVESRKLALEALGKIGDEKSIPAILNCLDDPILSVRYAVGPACARIGAVAVNPLLQALKDGATVRRAAAAAALGHVRSPQSADALLAALDDPHLPVRQAATEALGELGDARAVAPLAKLLQEPMRASDFKLFQERMAAPVPADEARSIAKILRDREGHRRIPVVSAMQRINSRGKQKDANDTKKDFVEEETAQLQELVTPPATSAKTAEIAAIIADRISPERWAALDPGQQELSIAKETAHLKTLWEEPGTELKTEQLNLIIAQRCGRRWWDGLTDKQRQELIRREYLRPIEDEQRYSGTEMRRSVAQALAKINQASALEILLQATTSATREISDFSQAALQSLAPAAIPALTTLVANAQVPVPLRAQALTLMSRFRDPQLVDAFMAVVNGTEPTLRATAAQGLAKLGDARAVAPLSRVLKEGDAGSRRIAATALGGLGKTDAVPALMTAANDPDSNVRQAAIDALGRLGDARAGESVLAALQREQSPAVPDQDLLGACARALGLLKEKRAVEPLIALLNQVTSKQNAESSADFARALGRIGDPRAVEPLMAFIEKRIWGPCFTAAEALGEIGDPRAIDFLEKKVGPGPFPEMRPIAITALGKIRDPRAIEALVRVLSNPNSDYRKSAAEALITHGERAVPRLLEELQSDNADRRGLVAQTLGYIGKPAVEPLLKGLDHPPIPEALPAIIYALSMIRDDRITTPLVGQMKHASAEIRANVAWALGYCENETALFALKNALKDEDVRVRKSAESALDRLRPLLVASTAGTNATPTVKQ
jgi:HEAT repeat protein